MKVLHITPSYFPAFKFGGPIQSVHLLNKTLAKKGIEVDVITTNVGLSDNQEIRTGTWINLEGVRVKYLPYYFYENYSFSSQLLVEILRNLNNYDLIHITAVWNFPVFAGSLASILHRKPYIISPRGTLNREAVYTKSRLIKQVYYQLVTKQCIQNAYAIHFTSRDEKENVTNFLKLKNKSFVIPNGIDLNEYSNLSAKGSFKTKYPILKDKKYILFLGRITKKKGLDLLVESFKELVKFDDNLFLVVAGPDDEGYGRVVKNQIKSCGLMEKTLFTGMLHGKNKLSAYVDAELFVLPSYSENFGMTVIEAMACGTPVMVSNKVGIYNEVKENNAGFVVNSDVNSLCDGIKSFLTSKELGEKLIRNARNLVYKDYDIDVIAVKMINAYEEILSGFRR